MAFASAEPTRERVNHEQKPNQNDQTIKQTKKQLKTYGIPECDKDKKYSRKGKESFRLVFF